MLLWILCRDLQLMTHVTVAAINAADCSSGKKLSTYVAQPGAAVSCWFDRCWPKIRLCCIRCTVLPT